MKLGVTPASDLPWEYEARIRPWLQPLLYFLIASPLSRWVCTTCSRWSSCCGWLTGLVLGGGAGGVRARHPGHDRRRGEKRAFLCRYLPFFGFLPYLFVRTSSETLSAAFFALGLARGDCAAKTIQALGRSGSVVRFGVRGRRYRERDAGAGPVRLACGHRARSHFRVAGLCGRRGDCARHLARWPTAGAMAPGCFRPGIISM